jgi:two-component system chemotaxis family response regulator WspR
MEKMNISHGNADHALAPRELESSLAAFKVTVLLVDDQLIIAEAVRRLLADDGDIAFHYVCAGEQALQAAIDLKPTVILQDLVMPDSDGFELVQRYRAHPETENIPIIVLSTKEDPKFKARGFAVGANDYVIKLPDRLELLARIRYHSAGYISRLQRDAAFRSLHESQQKLSEANIELKKLASLDGLTGIANRRRFDEALQSELLRAHRTQTSLSLFMCDIDYFKIYNDTYGHLAGDLCLKKVAAALSTTLQRPADLAARYGGEEFALILPDTHEKGAIAVADICRRQVEALAIPNRGSADYGHITVSIGLVNLLPSVSVGPEQLIGMADSALYKAKRNGRNQVQCFVNDV